MLPPSLYCGQLMVVSANDCCFCTFPSCCRFACTTPMQSHLLPPHHFYQFIVDLQGIFLCCGLCHCVMLLLLAAAPDTSLCLGSLLDIATGGLTYEFPLMPLLAVGHQLLQHRHQYSRYFPSLHCCPCADWFCCCHHRFFVIV